MTMWSHLHVESKKYNKLVNITEKKSHRHTEPTTGYQWVGEWEAPSAGCKTGTRMCYGESSQHFVITVNGNLKFKI